MSTVEETVSEFADVEDELIFIPAVPDKDPELSNSENAPGKVPNAQRPTFLVLFHWCCSFYK